MTNLQRWTPPWPPLENGIPEICMGGLPLREYCRREALAQRQTRYRVHTALRAIAALAWLALNLAALRWGWQ